MFRFGDFNGDGILDVVYTNPAENLVTVYFVNLTRSCKPSFPI